MKTHDLLGDVEAFLNLIFRELECAGIDVDAYELDHICYRVTSLEGYEQKKKQLDPYATMLTEVLINGRQIATYELHEPIIFRNRSISVIELPQPKAGKITHEGLEHVEFVIHESFASFMQRYPQLNFDSKGSNKAHNPEIELAFGAVTVKFHHQALKK